jgi:hypothetical protein
MREGVEDGGAIGRKKKREEKRERKGKGEGQKVGKLHRFRSGTGLYLVGAECWWWRID